MVALHRWQRSCNRLLQDVTECSVCNAVIVDKHRHLCFYCLQRFSSGRWSGCTRCGESSCAGACGQLSWLTSVTALFNYSAQHRQLLLAAKDQQNYHAIQAFFECYSFPAVQKISQLIVAHDVDLIILARLRLRRIVTLEWHPFEFWNQCAERALDELLRNGHMMRRPRIQTFLPDGIQKQARKSSEKRRRNLFFYERSQGIKRGVISGCGVRSILILDDVLTSGGSLHKEYRELLGWGNEADRPEVHCLTLFRTPAAAAQESERVLNELER